MDNTTLPETLYHATFPDAVVPILHSGLQPNDLGIVNLVNEPQYAAGFIAVRNFSKLIDLKMIDVNGVSTPRFEHSVYHAAEVLAVDVRRLDIDKLEVNETETGAAASGGLPSGLVSYIYRGVVPPDAIHIADVFPQNDERIPPHFAP